MASTLALVFKRLYANGEISKEDVAARVKSVNELGEEHVATYFLTH